VILELIKSLLENAHCNCCDKGRIFFYLKKAGLFTSAVQFINSTQFEKYTRHSSKTIYLNELKFLKQLIDKNTATAIIFLNFLGQ